MLDAWEGYARSKGINPHGNTRLTAEDVTELRRMIDADGGHDT